MTSGGKAVALESIAALSEPERLLRALVECLPVAVMVVDQHRVCLVVNSRAQAWLEKLDAAASTPWQEFPELFDSETERMVPLDRTPLARALRGESSEGERYMVRRSRACAPLWIECGAYPTTIPGRESPCAVFFFSDITAKRKQEFAAESANELRDFIYRENVAGVIHATVDGRIIDCNDAILRMWGYSTREELFAMRIPQLYYDLAESDRMLNRLNASGGRLNEFEVCFRRHDGSRLWAIVNVRLLDAPRGQVGGTVVTTIIDITERKIWEETLRLSEQRFAAFMRHLPGVAFIKDLTGKYVYYNEAATTLFGVKPDEIVGRTDDQFWSSEHATRYRENDALVVECKRPLEFVELVLHPDGPHSWLMYKFPIVENGSVVLVGGVGIDITERTILEEQLTQSRKMDALGRLAGGVAHDFNNLLTVISGYGQLALEGIGEIPEERTITYLQEVLNSSRRASALTGQLLAFSRRQVVQPKVVDLCELLRNMQRLLRRVIGEHVAINVNASGQCPVVADPHQMEQVVMNLAVNARDAMPLGGSLDIRCECLEMPEPSADGDGESLAILLEVRDTGIGMDEKIRPRIFDPFFTSKEKGKGTGLGLSMVYGIVAQARGKIAVESAVGEGTVFRLFFPRADGPIDSVAPARMGAPKGVETVLLVEDEPAVRTLAETILLRLGYKVLVADSGQNAVQLWEVCRGKVDVLLTDVIMPKMSGGELAHQLRASDPALKILFMSGYTDDMIADHGVLAGETQLIQKPFTAESLGRKLRDILDA